MDSTTDNNDKSFIEKVKDGVTDLAQNIEHALGIGIVLPGENNEESSLEKIETDLVETKDLSSSSWNQTSDESFGVKKRDNFTDLTRSSEEYSSKTEKHEFGPSEWELNREQESERKEAERLLEQAKQCSGLSLEATRQAAQCMANATNNYTEYAKDKTEEEWERTYDKCQDVSNTNNEINSSLRIQSNIAQEKSQEHAEKARDRFVEGTVKADSMCENAINQAQQEFYKIRQEYRQGTEKAVDMYDAAQKDANKAQAKSNFYAELAVDKRQQGNEIAIILCEQVKELALRDEVRAQQEYQKNVEKASEMYTAAEKEANKELNKSKQYADKALHKLEEAKQMAIKMCEKAKEKEQVIQTKARETYEADVIKANEIFEAAQKEAVKAQEQAEYYTRKALEIIQKGKEESTNYLTKAKEKVENESLKAREQYVHDVREAGERFYAAQKEVNKELEKSDYYATEAERKRQQGSAEAFNMLEKAEEKAQHDTLNAQLNYERGLVNAGELYAAEQKEAIKAEEKSEQYANVAVEKRVEGKERAINMMENVADKAQIDALNAKQNYQCNVQIAGQVYSAAQNEFNREKEKSDFYANKAEEKREQILENPNLLINNNLNTRQTYEYSSTQEKSNFNNDDFFEERDRINRNLNRSNLNELPHAQNPNYRGGEDYFANVRSTNDQTKDKVENLWEKTKDTAEAAVDKTKEAYQNTKEKAGEIIDKAREKTAMLGY